MSQKTESPPITGDPPTSQLCSLSRVDSIFSPLVYTACLVINCPGDNFDESIYQAAVEKAIDKNRIFAGRVQKEKINDLLQLLVPLGELPKDYKLCNFSCQTIDKFINYPQLNSSAHEIITMPDLTYFRASNTPTNVSEFIEKDLPIFTFLVTKLRNMVCIGITFTHVVVDGGALDLFVKSINEELDNVSGFSKSKPIPLRTENLLETRYRELSNREGIRDEVPEFPYFCEINSKTIAKNILKFLWEYTWHQSRSQVLYVGRDLVTEMVSKAKAEAIATGTFISTNDILMAWLMNTIYSGEKSNSNTLSAISVATPRETLGLEQYAYNSISLVKLPLPSIASLVSEPIWKTALNFRKAVEHARVQETLDKELVRICDTLGSSIAAVEIGVDHWMFNNQTIAALFNTNWSRCLKEEPKEGSEPVRVVGNVYRRDCLQNCISIIEMNKEGFIIRADIRMDRWRSIRREVERLEALHGTKLLCKL